MQRETYLCTKEDLPDLIQIINDTTAMYGADLHKIGAAKVNIERLQNIFSNKKPTNTESEFFVIGHKENGVLVGFCINAFWASLPVWHCGPYFTKLDIFDKVASEILLLSVIKKGIELAESRSVFSFYYITRFSRQWKRSNNMIMEQFPDYSVSEVEVLEPFTKSKYATFAMLLGVLDGRNEKPIAVLHCTKSVTYGNLDYKRNDGLHI
jgi:hypothetical protein